MNSAAPYRTPCDGWNRPPFSGPCYQHKRKAESAVPVYYNVTLWEGATPINGTSGPTADACAEGDVSAAGNCYHAAHSMVTGATTDDAGYSTGDTVITLAAAGVGSINAGDVVTFGTSGAEHTVVTGDGVVADGGTIELDAPGLLLDLAATEHAITVVRHAKDFSLCHKSGWKAVRADKSWHGMYGFDHCTTDCNADPDKYLVVNRTMSATFRYTGPPANDDPHRSIAWERTYTVDKDSGVIAQSDCVQPTEEEVDNFLEADATTTSGPGATAANLINNALLEMDCGDYAMNGDAAWGAVLDGEGTGKYPMDWLNGDAIPYLPWGGGALYPTIAADTQTATHVGFTLTSAWPTPALGVKFELVVRITADLSDPYTISDCCADAFSLLDEYDLTDDTVYPWRTDANCARVPVVKRDEPSSVTPGTLWWLTCDVVDPNTNSGDVIGVPNPAGYGSEVFSSGGWGHFAFGLSHEIWSGAAIIGDGSGEWTPDYLPKTATWWSTLSDEGYPAGSVLGRYPEGAYVVLGAFDVVHAQKWAAIKETHDSINFFRPCGADRDVVGVIAPCAVDGSQYHWDGSSASRPKAWPICGHVAFTAVEAAGTVTVTLVEEAEHLVAGDFVSFVKYAANYTRTTTDSAVEVATVAGDFLSFTYTGSLPDATATHVVSHIPVGSVTNMGDGPKDAPHYQWHETDAKGDFTYREWITDACGDPDPTVEFTCFADCIKRSPCHPSVVCVSPNAESFMNGVTYDLPAVATPSETFQSVVVTEMGDPFWVRPYGCLEETPVDTCTETPANPLCLQAIVEPLCEAPVGAPAIPFYLPCPEAVTEGQEGECTAPVNGLCGMEVDWV